MNLVKNLNAVTSQVWAVVLLLIGVATIFLSDYAHQDVVMKSLLSAGGGIVGGALILFQHQTGGKTLDEPKPAVDPVQPHQP
jgi:hypothetical protein